MNKWLNFYIRILDGEKDIPSPFDKEGILEWIFVIIDKKDLIGYLLVWCSKTHKGVQYSRVKIPEDGFRSVFVDDLSTINIPKISLQEMRM